jgi:hypothetical protein
MMQFNGREVTESDLWSAAVISGMVTFFGLPDEVNTQPEVEAWYLHLAKGDQWLADLAAFMTVVEIEMNETGCTLQEAVNKYSTPEGA